MLRNPIRRCASKAASVGYEEGPERYAVASRWLHWISGGGMLTCTGLVLGAQYGYPAWDKCNAEEAAAKGNLMFWHKSVGLTMLGVMIPRVYFRFAAPGARPLPGISSTEQLLGKLSHAAMYVPVIVLPVTGFTMGYAGDKGLPFFFTTLKPASGEFGKATNGPLAGQAYKLHKQVGVFLEYMIPLHLTAAFGHQFFQGINIFTRVNPFA